MHLNLPWYLPFGLFVAGIGSRTAVHMRKEKRHRGDMSLMLGLTWLPLVIWLFLQFFPQE